MNNPYPTLNHFWTIYKLLPPLTLIEIKVMEQGVEDVLIDSLSTSKAEYDTEEHREMLADIKHLFRSCGISSDTMLRKVVFTENFGFGYSASFHIYR